MEILPSKAWEKKAVIYEKKKKIIKIKISRGKIVSLIQVFLIKEMENKIVLFSSLEKSKARLDGVWNNLGQGKVPINGL